MIELKTLKEIDLSVKKCPISALDNLVGYTENERKNRLRQEAIKWIKELDLSDYKRKFCLIHFTSECQCDGGIRQDIMGM